MKSDGQAEMLIIADDLSGAADCGIACTLAGLDTVVVLGEATCQYGPRRYRSTLILGGFRLMRPQRRWRGS